MKSVLMSSRLLKIILRKRRKERRLLRSVFLKEIRISAP